MNAYWQDDRVAVSVNAVCALAGVSKPWLYRDFRSEDGLTAAVLDAAVLERYGQTVLVSVEALLSSPQTYDTRNGAEALRLTWLPAICKSSWHWRSAGARRARVQKPSVPCWSWRSRCCAEGLPRGKPPAAGIDRSALELGYAPAFAAASCVSVREHTLGWEAERR